MGISDFGLRNKGQSAERKEHNGFFLYVVIQKEQVVSNVEAAPTESLSNGNLDFPDKQVPLVYALRHAPCAMLYVLCFSEI